jgi:Choline/Carnitine o-acyltransferase
VLCLDSCSPVTRDEVARELWHGDGTNRWYDKSVQLVVFANGKAGMMVSFGIFMFIHTYVMHMHALLTTVQCRLYIVSYFVYDGIAVLCNACVRRNGMNVHA